MQITLIKTSKRILKMKVKDINRHMKHIHQSIKPKVDSLQLEVQDPNKAMQTYTKKCNSLH